MSSTEFVADPEPLTSLSRRGVLGGGLAAALTVAVPPVSFAVGTDRRGPKLIVGGVAKAAFVLDDKANGYLKVDLERRVIPWIEQMTGVKLPLYRVPSNPPPDDIVRINVGFVEEGTRHKVAPLLEGLDRDGYVVVPHGDVLTITGTTWWGTISALRHWLSTLGVAWLMPTDVGTYLPKLSEVVMPSNSTRQQPGFPARMVSPLVYNPWYSYITWPREQYLWAQDNRLSLDHDRKVSFHHNMNSLFPVKELGTTHPEYYSGGRPPAPGQTTGWQPVFSNPDTITWAINRICEYFEKNPGTLSYSLGVNDNDGFDERDLAQPGGLTATYYSWVNKVVEGVLKRYPDRWFGLLAYTVLEEPPTFPLHPRVVPFLTQDRMAWIDPEVKAHYQGRVREWRKVTSTMGFYDYAYGDPYMVPRMYMEQLAENLRFARDNGVDYHYIELYPYVGEGPKAWVVSKLLWNPDLNVKALMDEWYRLAVGSAAAPYLARFYEHWEKFWTDRAPKTSWFQKRATMQAFFSGGYLDAVTPDDIAVSRSLMQQVVARAGSPQQKQRAEVLWRAFEFYEASALSYPKTKAAPTSASQALTMLADIEANWEERARLAQLRADLITQTQKHPLELHFNDGIGKWGLSWGAWNESEFWGLHDYLKHNEGAGGPVTDRLTGLASGSNQLAEFASLLLAVSAGELTNLVKNPSFEDGETDWFLWVTAGQNTLTVTSDAASDGRRSVKIAGTPRGGPAQMIPAKPGLMVGRVQLLASAGKEYFGTVQPAFNVFNAAGKQIGKVNGKMTQAGARAGDWVDVDFLAELPAEVAKVQFVCVVNGFAYDPPAYVDDIRIYQRVS